jgi:uncharacterized SAM-binding protein YcdF (DUF218 family)
VISRLIGFALIVWLFGFVAFTLLLPGPADDRATDGVVVLTGGPGRIEHGVALLLRRRATRLLVAGVNRSVKPHELAAQVHAPATLFDCCVDLDRESVDTRSNAAQTAAWLGAHHYRSVRLVTTDWHMPRARFELGRLIGKQGILIVSDPVPSEPGFQALFGEYNKYLLRRAIVALHLA